MKKLQFSSSYFISLSLSLYKLKMYHVPVLNMPVLNIAIVGHKCGYLKLFLDVFSRLRDFLLSSHAYFG